MERNLAARFGREPWVGEQPLVAVEEPEHLAFVLHALYERLSRLRRRVC